jgi:hypothetical protein
VDPKVMDMMRYVLELIFNSTFFFFPISRFIVPWFLPPLIQPRAWSLPNIFVALSMAGRSTPSRHVRLLPGREVSVETLKEAIPWTACLAFLHWLLGCHGGRVGRSLLDCSRLHWTRRKCRIQSNLYFQNPIRASDFLGMVGHQKAHQRRIGFLFLFGKYGDSDW